MKFRLLDSVGEKIIGFKYTYNNQNKFGLREFHSFFKLTNNTIIQIPNYPDEEFDQTILNAIYSRINNKSETDNNLNLIIGKKILNFHFYYFENELDEERKSIIELDDDIFITEVSFGPIGLTNVDLKIMNTNSFLQLKESLEEEFKIKTLLEKN